MDGPEEKEQALVSEQVTIANGRRDPERRDVSVRSLYGLMAVSVTSNLVMSLAFLAAVGGQLQLPDLSMTRAPVPAGDKARSSTVGAETASQFRELPEKSDGSQQNIAGKPLFIHAQLARPFDQAEPDNRRVASLGFRDGDAMGAVTDTGPIYPADPGSAGKLKGVRLPFATTLEDKRTPRSGTSETGDSIDRMQASDASYAALSSSASLLPVRAEPSRSSLTNALSSMPDLLLDDAPAAAAYGDAGAAAMPGQAIEPTRFSLPAEIFGKPDRRRIEIPVITAVGDQQIIRQVPFVHVRMVLSAGPPPVAAEFEPERLEAPAERKPPPAIDMGLIYRADLDDEVKLRAIDFPFAAAERPKLGATAEDAGGIRQAIDGVPHQRNGVADIDPFDATRFGASMAISESISASLLRPAAAEGSTFQVSPPHGFSRKFFKSAMASTIDKSVADAVSLTSYREADAGNIADFFARVARANASDARAPTGGSFGAKDDLPGDAESVDADAARQSGMSVRGPETQERGLPTALDEAAVPTVYDAIYMSASTHGFPPQLTKLLIELLSVDFDEREPLRPTDRLDVFFSLPADDDQATDGSELYFIRAFIGGSYRTFYRHEKQDGDVEYFGPEGRSFEQFLLRTPLASARFEAGFGMRRHPILGYDRMHTGVDWSAPLGTPVYAAASGIVEDVGWKGDYGTQTVIRHVDGYVTSYSHQSSTAADVVSGAHVRQGQIIGFVGATGLATGNHLHYEVMVDGKKVDPMRLAVPKGSSLKGPELDAFLAERDRIDTVLYEEVDSVLNLASASR